jgi:integrase
MPTHSADNERVKHRYLLYLKEARRLSESSIDTAMAAIARFEAYTKHRDFRRFHIKQAVAFKRSLSEAVSARTGERLSSSTVLATLNALRAFFEWLAMQPGYRSRIAHPDAHYFALSERETRIAKTTLERPVPTVEQILRVLRHMPFETEIQLRNRALVAFTLLTGARDGAIATMKLKHVNIEQRKIVQDAREVRTKFAKSFESWFFPVGDEVHSIVDGWVSFLLYEKLFGSGDPVFPATLVGLNQDHHFRAEGLSRDHWSNATPIRLIFKQAFTAAGLPYANPHSFRKTLAQLGERLCHTPEEFKAWSQNLGHEQVLTTFSSYGHVRSDRQAELICGMGQRRPTKSSDGEILQRVMQVLAERRNTRPESPL